MPKTYCPLFTDRTKRLAFSLVELLVVIGVLAILVAVLVPVMSRARESANTTKCLSNLAQLGKAHLAYVSQNDNFIVPPETMLGAKNGESTVRETWTTTLVSGGFVGAYPVVTDVNAPAIRNTVFDCPSSSNEIETYGTAVDAFGVKPASPLDPINQVGWRFRSTLSGAYVDSWYIIPSRSATSNNDFISFRYAAESSNDPAQLRADRRVTINSVRRPAEVMLILEGIGGMNMGRVSAGSTGFPPGLSDTTVGRNRIASRHGNSARLADARSNVLFLDGHAETLPRKQLPFAFTNGTSAIVEQLGWSNLPGGRRFK